MVYKIAFFRNAPVLSNNFGSTSCSVIRLLGLPMSNADYKLGLTRSLSLREAPPLHFELFLLSA